MSIQTLLSQISSIDRDIASIESQRSAINSKISSKHRELASIIDRMNREKDLKRIASHLKDQAKKTEEIAKLEQDKTSKSKNLAAKTKTRTELQVKLAKEEKRERDGAMKEQKELLSLQQEISREMDRQRIRSLEVVNVIKPVLSVKKYDVFISHASEDKDEFVRPFANNLKDRGLQVWYDEFELRVGDSLRQSIDKGLANSKYGIVVLSAFFFSKEWPQKELNGLFAREVNGEKVILPIWHKISKDEVMRYSPMVADMLALTTASFTIDEIAHQIANRILSK